jgi:ribonucleoside-diphosphate reductase alpha chain
MAKSSGLKVTRKYTSKGDPYKGIVWEKRTSKIANPDGSVVFEMENVEIPSTWSQVATDIMVSKYFRKAGVPQVDDEGNTLKDENGDTILGSETSSRQVFDRLAETWRHWGETTGYFATKDDAQAFEDELKYMLATQMAAPNSPQWFNTGLNHKYDLTGPKQGFWYVDPKSGELVEADDSYSRPQPHACFIQSIDDDLVNEGGIMDLWVKEARLFKFGSGTGTNFSNLRGEGEKLSGGGVSSGVMSFLKIGDRAAGAISLVVQPEEQQKWLFLTWIIQILKLSSNGKQLKRIKPVRLLQLAILLISMVKLMPPSQDKTLTTQLRFQQSS